MAGTPSSRAGCSEPRPTWPWWLPQTLCYSTMLWGVSSLPSLFVHPAWSSPSLKYSQTLRLIVSLSEIAYFRFLWQFFNQLRGSDWQCRTFTHPALTPSYSPMFLPAQQHVDPSQVLSFAKWKWSPPIDFQRVLTLPFNFLWLPGHPFSFDPKLNH